MSRSLGTLVGPCQEFWGDMNISPEMFKNITNGKEYFRDLKRDNLFADNVGKMRTVAAWEFDTEILKKNLLKEGMNILKNTSTSGPLSDDPLVNPKKAMGILKAPMHNMSPLVMITLENVLAGGGYKYGYMNYRDSEVDAQTYIGAIKRHFAKWQDGVDFDDESFQHELAHVMACCAIMIDAHYTGKFIDNRSKTGLVEKALKKSGEDFKLFMKNHDEKMRLRELADGNKS